jgi:hypothetical protein
MSRVTPKHVPQRYTTLYTAARLTPEQTDDDRAQIMHTRNT